MKPLLDCNNIEKARLLHTLFPDEIPAFLEFVTGMCLTIKEHETEQRAKWDNGLFSFDFWLSLVSQVEQQIDRYQTKLSGSSKLFSEQLFDGYLAMYTEHCLRVYTTTRQHPNRKFTIAVDLIFNP